MYVRGCNVTLPLPIVMWPTSELPICPFGRPTYSPDASNSVWGYTASNLSMTGVFAAFIAFPNSLLFIP